MLAEVLLRRTIQDFTQDRLAEESPSFDTLFRQSSRVGPEEYLSDECLRILARLPKRLLIAPDMHAAPHTIIEEGSELVGSNIVAGALGRYLPGIEVPSQRAARNCGGRFGKP